MSSRVVQIPGPQVLVEDDTLEVLDEHDVIGPPDVVDSACEVEDDDTDGFDDEPNEVV